MFSIKNQISDLSNYTYPKASHAFVIAATTDETNIPTNLKVNMLTYAYGIPTESPTFSWVMNSIKSNQLQTAYEIVISKSGVTSANVFDTGKVISRKSSYVKIKNLKLSENCLYYWKVRVWDSTGAVSGYSEPSAITTEPSSKWASNNAIWAGDTVDYTNSNWKDYSISFDMNITSGASAVNFRATNGSKSCYSWQFDTVQNQLIPQVRVNGKTTQLSSVNLSSYGIRIQPNQYYSMKIVAFGNTISTYIEDIMVDKRTVKYLSSGSFGFRNGASDSCAVKNILAYSLNKSGNPSKTLYSDTFASDVNTFSGGKVSDSELDLDNNTDVSLKPVAAKGDFVFLRTEFNIKDRSDIKKAIVNVTSPACDLTRQYTYCLYLNGSSVGVGPCESTSNEVRFNTYNVTSRLKNGNNAIGSLNYTLSDKRFLLQMTVYYKDGTSEVLLNSGRDYKSWHSLDGTRIFGENTSIGTIFYTQAAENIDATLYPFGWDNAGYNDSAWQPVKLAGAFTLSELVPSPESNVRRFKSNVVKVIDKGKGDYFIDVGKEVIGGLSLSATCNQAAQITVRCGEQKDGQSSVIYYVRAGNVYEEKWTLKKGHHTITNFGLKAFRYIEILNSPVPITTDNIHAISVRQRFDNNASAFYSSSPTLNRIYNLTKYSIKETNQALQVDSQSRERGAYQGDALINMLSSFAVSSDPTLSQYTAEYLNYHGTWPAEYKLMSVILTWNDYLYTGNLDMIRKNYSILKSDRLYDRLFDPKYNLLKRATTKLNSVDYILIDWPIGEQDGYDSEDAEYNTVLNAVAYGAYKDMAHMANRLGITADKKAYAAKAAEIKTAMMKYLYNAKVGAFSDGLTTDGVQIDHYAQHASAFSLAFGVATDPSVKKSVADYLGKDGTFKSSVYGAMFTLTGLYKANAGDTALKMMTGNGMRTWNHMLKSLGATITAEEWDPTIKPNMTFSHPWGTAPASQIVSGIFGIQPITAGFSSFQIKFQPGSLTYAAIKVPTVKGTIEASFNKTSGFTSTVIIPDNTKATIYIPKTDDDSNTLLVDDKKITAVRSGSYLIINLGSGKHTASCTSCTGGKSRF